MQFNVTPATPYVRLDVVIAPEAGKAVVLRRGPKWQFRLISWDLASDTFTPGQWMTGRVHLQDLSADGRYLIYDAEQRKRLERDARRAGPIDAYEPILQVPPKPKRPRRRVPRYMQQSYNRDPLHAHEPYPVGAAWTAISRPPYFTALALWPRAGGGLFDADGNVILFAEDRGLLPVVKTAWPRGRRIISWFDVRDTRSFFDRAALRPTAIDRPVRRAFQRAIEPTGARFVDWVTPLPDGRLAFAVEGRLFVVRAWREDDFDGWIAGAEPIADFSDMTFELVAPAADAVAW